MTMRSSTFLVGFSVKFFVQANFTDYAYFGKKNHIKSFPQKHKMILSLVGPVSKYV
jgi:hypothetical protein